MTLSLLVAWHLVWAQSRLRPPVPLDGRARPFARVPAVPMPGSEGGFRIVEANGQPIADRRGLHSVFDQGSKSKASLLVRREVDGAREDRLVLWKPVAFVPEIAIGDDLKVAARALDPALGEGDVRILQINGETPLDRARRLTADLETALCDSTHRCAVPAAPRPRSTSCFFIRSWRVQWALWIAGHSFFLLGWGVLYLKPRQRSSWGFATFALGLGLGSLMRSIRHPYRLSYESLAFLTIQALLPALFAAFLLTFTPLRQLVRPVRRVAVRRGRFRRRSAYARFPAVSRLGETSGCLATPLFVTSLGGDTRAGAAGAAGGPISMAARHSAGRHRSPTGQDPPARLARRIRAHSGALSWPCSPAWSASKSDSGSSSRS